MLSNYSPPPPTTRSRGNAGAGLCSIRTGSLTLAGRHFRVGCPRGELFSPRRQRHVDRSPVWNACPLRWTQFDACGKMDLDSNVTERLVARIRDPPHEGVGRRIEGQLEPRVVPRLGPAGRSSDINARLLPFFTVLLTVCFFMLTAVPLFTALSTRHLSAALAGRTLVSLLSEGRLTSSICVRLRFSGAGGQPK